MIDPGGALDRRRGALVALGALADAAVERLAGALAPAPSDAASRYFWKLSVVPDSSLRKTTLILSPGRVLPEFSAVISGAFQVVTAPLKILASGRSVESHAVDARKVVGDRDRSEHRRQVPRSAPPQRALALSTSPFSAFSGESEPPKSVCLPMNSETPAPEPLDV